MRGKSATDEGDRGRIYAIFTKGQFRLKRKDRDRRPVAGLELGAAVHWAFSGTPGKSRLRAAGSRFVLLLCHVLTMMVVHAGPVAHRHLVMIH